MGRRSNDPRGGVLRSASVARADCERPNLTIARWRAARADCASFASASPAVQTDPDEGSLRDIERSSCRETGVRVHDN